MGGEIGDKALKLQQLILGETTQETVRGQVIRRRAIAALVVDQATGDTFAIPWDPKEGAPVVTIRTLRNLSPELADEARNALRRAPKQRVKPVKR